MYDSERSKDAVTFRPRTALETSIVLDRPLAEAKELVDDPAAFTREMTRILRYKQTHPLIAQMMRPAESSDPPPATAAASGASSSGEPRTTSHA